MHYMVDPRLRRLSSAFCAGPSDPALTAMRGRMPTRAQLVLYFDRSAPNCALMSTSDDCATDSSRNADESLLAGNAETRARIACRLC